MEVFMRENALFTIYWRVEPLNGALRGIAAVGRKPTNNNQIELIDKRNEN